MSLQVSFQGVLLLARIFSTGGRICEQLTTLYFLCRSQEVELGKRYQADICVTAINFGNIKLFTSTHSPLPESVRL